MGSANRFSLTALLSLVPTIVAASTTPKGQTIEVNGNSYYVPTTAVTTLKIPSGQEHQKNGLLPLTVIRSDASKLTTSLINSLVNAYQTDDDVFNTGFLESRQPFSMVSRSSLANDFRYLHHV
jgi:hypothetical protein